MRLSVGRLSEPQSLVQYRLQQREIARCDEPSRGELRGNPVLGLALGDSSQRIRIPERRLLVALGGRRIEVPGWIQDHRSQPPVPEP